MMLQCTLEEHVAIIVPCWFMLIQDMSCWWALIRISVAAFSGDTVATKSCVQTTELYSTHSCIYSRDIHTLSIDIYSVSTSNLYHQGIRMAIKEGESSPTLS